MFFCFVFFRRVLRHAMEPERPSLTSLAWGTSRACRSGSWRRSWQGISSTIPGAVKNGSWWSVSTDCTEKRRRIQIHVGVYLAFGHTTLIIQHYIRAKKGHHTVSHFYFFFRFQVGLVKKKKSKLFKLQCTKKWWNNVKYFLRSDWLSGASSDQLIKG